MRMQNCQSSEHHSSVEITLFVIVIIRVSHSCQFVEFAPEAAIRLRLSDVVGELFRLPLHSFGFVIVFLDVPLNLVSPLHALKFRP